MRLKKVRASQSQLCSLSSWPCPGADTACAVLRCAVCCRTHLSPNYGPFPFPKDMFLKFVREKNGFFPVKIQALADGTCVHVHTPVYQVGSRTDVWGRAVRQRCSLPAMLCSWELCASGPCKARAGCAC